MKLNVNTGRILNSKEKKLNTLFAFSYNFIVLHNSMATTLSATASCRLQNSELQNSELSTTPSRTMTTRTEHPQGRVSAQFLNGTSADIIGY